CTTGSADPSHVLTAMGYPDEEARGALRFSLGRSTSDAEVDEAVEIVPRVVRAARDAAAMIAAERAAFRAPAAPVEPATPADAGTTVAS
ncbi:MAG TPA: hypothetical protein VFX65_06845, partial [Candidatus Limnocylindrales bacterium]|nr:hypothetical protein [Candidatus Limnocylindrales bacterium]